MAPRNLGGRAHPAVALIGAIVWVGCGSAQEGSFEEDEGAFNGDGSAGELVLTTVEFNQGTRVDVAVGGQSIAPPDRAGVLLANRDTWVGVHYETSSDWDPREVEARLFLESQGTAWSLERVAVVTGDAEPDDAEGSFWFALDAESGEAAEDLRYRVELVDFYGAFISSATSPASGTAHVGFVAQPMILELVVVPIVYEGVEPPLSEENLSALLDGLYERNPITQLKVEVHEPVVYEGNLFELALLLPELTQLRELEGAGPQVYYHGVIDVGEATLGGLRGIAGIAGAGPEDAVDRVAATVLWPGNPALSFGTFTHEMGHAQGLVHVDCAASPADGATASYPYADGVIGVRGVGVRSQQVYGAELAYDYMSYCSPRWVSDWTWAKTFARIETLSQWGASEPAPAPTPGDEAGGQLLMGMISARGEERWWLVRGRVDPRGALGPDTIEVDLPGGERAFVPTQRGWLSDGQTQWIKAALPAEWAVGSPAASLSRLRAGRRVPLTLAR